MIKLPTHARPNRDFKYPLSGFKKQNKTIEPNYKKKKKQLFPPKSRTYINNDHQNLF